MKGKKGDKKRLSHDVRSIYVVLANSAENGEMSNTHHNVLHQVEMAEIFIPLSHQRPELKVVRVGSTKLPSEYWGYL